MLDRLGAGGARVLVGNTIVVRVPRNPRERSDRVATGHEPLELALRAQDRGLQGYLAHQKHPPP